MKKYSAPFNRFREGIYRAKIEIVSVFTIYDTQLNGTVRWAEQIGSVVTRNGVFSAV